MAIKSIMYFSIAFRGDGVSNSDAVVLATAPFCLAGYGTIPGTAPSLSQGFTLGALVPTGVNSLSSSDGQAITASILLGVITFTWAGAVANGANITVNGIFEF